MPGLKHRIFFAALAIAIWVSLHAAASQAALPTTRREFAEGCGRIEKGMSKAQVRSILGEPDDTRDDLDPQGGTAYSEIDEEWRYGTSGHLTTATLGQVYFDKYETVRDIFGQGDPPPEGMFEERDLRRILGTLDEVPSYNASGNEFDPRKVIRAVNILQPLGKKKALAAVDEYLRVTSFWHDSGRGGVFLVLRSLFDVPNDPGYMQPIGTGQPATRPPKDRKVLPRFPIAIEGDIPFKGNAGYTIFGSAESPESHTDYFRQQGTIRATPLVPTDDPVGALAEFMKSPRWRYVNSDGEQNESWHDDHDLYEQLLRLLDTVIQPDAGAYGSLVPWNKAKAEKRLGEVARLKIRWDLDKCAYTFPDGTTLPKLKERSRLRHVWKPKCDGWDVELVIQRSVHPLNVTVTVCETYLAGPPAPEATLKIVDATTRKTLFECRAGDGRDESQFDIDTKVHTAGSTVGHSFGKGVKVDDGTTIQAELVIGQTTLLSPIFKP